jgi:HEAT repeat protein
MSRVFLIVGIACSLMAPMRAVGLDWAGKVQKDVRDLSSPDVQVRLRALRRVARYRDRKVKPLLLKALRDVDPQVQRLAASLVAQRGIREAVPSLLRWLSHWDQATRLSAAVNLGDLGDPRAVKTLVRALVDPELKVRLEVIAALGKLTSPDRVEVVPLLGRLRDTSSKVRKAAVEVLAGKRDRRAVIPLMGRLDDSAREVRIAAIAALGTLGDEKAGPSLVRLLRNSDHEVVSATIDTLGRLQYKGATEPLIDLLKGGSTTHRDRTASALGKIGTELALRALVSGLANRTLRPATTAALVEVGNKSAPFIADLLKDPRTPRDVAIAGVTVARSARIKRAVPLIIEHLRLGKLPLHLLVETLGHIGDARAQRPLLDLLNHPSLDIRLTALRALRSVVDRRAAEPLVRLLGDPSRKLRLRVIRYLGRLGSRLATPRLLRIARGNDRGLARAAVQALSRSRDSRAVNTLVGLLSSRDRTLRRMASQALARIHDPRSVQPVLRLCKDSLGSVRVTCLQTLGGVLRGTTNDDALALLEKMIRGSDRAVFLAAVDALAAMRDPRIAKLLIRRYPKLNPVLQRKVVAVLGNNASAKAALPHLLSVLRAKEASLKSAAAWAVGKLGRPDPTKQLMSAARDPSWQVRTNAVAALARLARPRARPLLRMLLSDPVPYVRANAVLGLGNIGDRKSIETLLKQVLDDRSPWVRVNTLRALIRMKVRGPLRTPDGRRSWKSLDELTHSVSREDLDARVRATARHLLRRDSGNPMDREGTWVGLFLLDYQRRPLRNAPVILVTPSGLIRAGFSDSRAELWEENLVDGYCYSELPPPTLMDSPSKN